MVSKRVVLVDVHWTPKTGTRVQKTERGYIRQNRPLTNRPFPGKFQGVRADPGVLWKKAPRAMRAMRGKTLETVPFQPYFGCTKSFLKVLSLTPEVCFHANFGETWRSLVNFGELTTLPKGPSRTKKTTG